MLTRGSSLSAMVSSVMYRARWTAHSSSCSSSSAPMCCATVQLGSVPSWEAHVSQHVGFGLVHQGGQLGQPWSGLVGDLAPLFAGSSRIVLGECRADPGRDDAALAFARKSPSKPHLYVFDEPDCSALLAVGGMVKARATAHANFRKSLRVIATPGEPSPERGLKPKGAATPIRTPWQCSSTSAREPITPGTATRGRLTFCLPGRTCTTKAPPSTFYDVLNLFRLIFGSNPAERRI